MQERHLASIPFEAIDVLLGRGIDISPAAVDAKLIGGHRGGYCYEQNGLLKRVLGAIGFEVTGLAASVRWMAKPGSPPPPRTHMALLVEIDGVPWLVDVGFGSSVPPAPLRMDIGGDQPTRHEPFRFIAFGRGQLLQARVKGEWQPLYYLSDEPMLDSQYEIFNWYASTHPDSDFCRNLILARTTPEARYSLLGNRLTIRPALGEVERRHLASDELEQALGDLFGLEVQENWAPLIEGAVFADGA